MNILIPDSWLRDFLKTKATPKQIKEYLSLSGPSVERIHTAGKDTIYDVEITTNRIDCMSVIGIAREAATILPEFGIKALFIPPKIPQVSTIQGTKPLGITIKNNPDLCYRIVAVKLENVHLGPSPKWLQNRLISVGQRPLNNIIDITNYVMWETGHPVHAFDYDRLKEKKIIVRVAVKGEHLVTLDGKRHTLRGGEIIFDDGTGEIIDLPGIMGTANTVITEQTNNVMFFIENSDPVKIRKASMGLAVRSEAAVINEKGPDPENVLPTLLRAVELAKKIAGANVASKLVDIYPSPIHPKPVEVTQSIIDTYLGISLTKEKIKRILTNLHCHVLVKDHKDSSKRMYHVTPPTFRANDIQIPQDIVEEIARIYGYHNIETHLPSREPPVTTIEPILNWEKEIKIRLRDWGYTETYSYSMISEDLMDLFKLDKKKAYKIANPLSSEWVYMRPSLWPSMLGTIKNNITNRTKLQLFELSMRYEYRENNLPDEKPTLLVAWTGEKFQEAKGLAESLFAIFGIKDYSPSDQIATPSDQNTRTTLHLGGYGKISIVAPELLTSMGIQGHITLLGLQFDLLVKHANPAKTYIPIPKYPPIIEDLSFTVIGNPAVQSMIDELSKQNKLIHSITLLDTYKNSRTFRITYLDLEKTLTVDDVKPIREKLISTAEQIFNATLKGS
jgi:phenylalanyl-tRNA synthetase beta chain